MEPVDLQSLWICGAQAPRSIGSTEHRLHGAQAPRSTGSTEPRMAAYHINGNTIHSMILANEHRSLGPIFIRSSRKIKLENTFIKARYVIKKFKIGNIFSI